MKSKKEVGNDFKCIIDRIQYEHDNAEKAMKLNSLQSNYWFGRLSLSRELIKLFRNLGYTE